MVPPTFQPKVTPMPSCPQKEYSPQFSTHIRCGQNAGWIKMPLGMEVSLGPGDFVSDGTQPPIFDPFLLWPTGRMDQDATWYGSRPRHRRHCVRWGPSSCYPTWAQPPPNFRPMSVVTKLLDESRCPGMVVGLGPGDVVLDGDQIPLKGAQPPVFGPCLLCPNGWMDEDATWYEGRPRPRSQCVRRGPSSTRKGHSTPSFRPMSIVAAVAHLSYC